MTPVQFKAIRESKDMSRAELANVLQITRMTVYNYETGKTKISGIVAMVMQLLDAGII